MSGKMANHIIEKNIDLALNEIQNLNTKVRKNNLRPTYKTLWQFSFETFFVFFGLQKSVLYRLTKTQYSNFLPNLIVVHNESSNETGDLPVLIERRLFVPDNYFRDWLLSSDNEGFEKQILELVLSQMQASTLQSAAN